MNKYIDKCKIGYGSSADIFKCVNKRNRRLYISKRIVSAPECIELSKMVFGNEYRACKFLQSRPHVNIIKMLDAIPEMYTLVFEYIPNNIDLFTLVGKFENCILPEEYSIKIINALISAVNHLIDCGIMHRDIKIENVLVNSTCSNVKLIDFGTATFKKTSTEIVGTIEYYSPERALDLEYTSSSDIWCVGVIAFEIAFGELPFMTSRQMTELKKLQACDWSFPNDGQYSSEYKEFIKAILVPNINRTWPIF
jgi:serine/threonine protein kinase